MAWREQLSQITLPDGKHLVAGSFRGVPFRTVDADLRIGRRTVNHEFPERDDPYVEDLGRRSRQYVIEAYVIGADYLSERNALITAIETKGPGELIHPRYGLLTVSVGDYVTVKETSREGGIARFSITFIEAGKNVFPAAIDNTVTKLDQTCTAADQAAENDFCSKFSVDGPTVLSEQGIKAITSRVNDVLKMVREVTSVNGLGQIVRDIAGLTGSVSALIRTPVVLVQSLRSIYGQFIQALRRPLSAFAELQSVFGANARSPAFALSGSTRARSLANATAVADLTRRLSLSNQARVLAVALSDTQVIGTADQAKALRDALVTQIDTELEKNDPPAEVATALTNMRAAVVRDVSARSEFLRRRATYKPAAVLPALVLAHRVYQDATRADELVLRNGVRHPAFVPAIELEVLQ